MNPTPPQKIIVLLTVLAEQSGEKVSPTRMQFMADQLLNLDAARVVKALENLVKSSRRFPTYSEVESAMGITPVTPESVEDKAREVAERIWTAIIKYGYTDWKRACQFIGEIGEQVVRMQGGWTSICEVATNDNATQLKAQWRGLAEALVRKHARGDTELPPSFDRLSESVQTLLLNSGKFVDIGKHS